MSPCGEIKRLVIMDMTLAQWITKLRGDCQKNTAISIFVLLKLIIIV